MSHALVWPCPRCGAHTPYTCCSDGMPPPRWPPVGEYFADFNHSHITRNTNNKENTNMTIRTDLIEALRDEFSADDDAINRVLDACALDLIPQTVDITATYTVTITFCDVPLDGNDPDDLDTYTLESLLDDDGRYCDVDIADDVEFQDAEVA